MLAWALEHCRTHPQLSRIIVVLPYLTIMEATVPRRWPEVSSSGVSRSHFLADTASVVLLLSKDVEDPYLKEKHGFFRRLMQEASSSVCVLLPAANLLSNAPEVEAIREECTRRKVKPNDRVTFRIESAIPLEQDSWHDWWREFRRGLSEKEGSSGPLRRCFVTGELTAPERTHLKISGLTSVGGQPAGDVLMGFDKDAFCSSDSVRERMRASPPPA